MPKWQGMAQLSRPFQIALGAALVGLALYAVWFVALRHPAGESSSSSPATSASSTTGLAPAGSSSAATQTRVYHGGAPGVEGLTRDIAKAHRAVGESQANAQELESKSAQASGEGGASATSSSSAATSSASSSAAKASATTNSATGASASTRTTKSGHSATGAGANAKTYPHVAALEGELAKGKTAVVLFWNPKGPEDRYVHEQLDDVSHGDRQIAVQVARSSEVTSYGQFTRVAQVTGTPTILIVNPHYQATTVTGLTDSFALQQAIGDAREGAGRVLAPQFSSWTPTSTRAKFIDEANHVCPAPRSTIAATLRSSLAGVTTVQGLFGALLNTVTVVAESAIHRVESLRMPARDRAFVHRQYALYLKGVHRIGVSGAPGSATALQRRAEYFEGQADIDQAANALVDYGLTNCK